MSTGSVLPIWCPLGTVGRGSQTRTGTRCLWLVAVGAVGTRLGDVAVTKGLHVPTGAQSLPPRSGLLSWEGHIPHGRCHPCPFAWRGGTSPALGSLWLKVTISDTGAGTQAGMVTPVPAVPAGANQALCTGSPPGWHRSVLPRVPPPPQGPSSCPPPCLCCWGALSRAGLPGGGGGGAAGPTSPTPPGPACPLSVQRGNLGTNGSCSTSPCPPPGPAGSLLSVFKEYNVLFQCRDLCTVLTPPVPLPPPLYNNGRAGAGAAGGWNFPEQL